MADKMIFPDTVEEFMEQYKIVDTEQVYTNGIELVPIFRMRQWFEERKLDEWCVDCKEYDHEKHCCPRFNRVIRETIDEIRPTGGLPHNCGANEDGGMKMRAIDIRDLDIPEQDADYDELADFADRIAVLATDAIEVAPVRRGKWLVTPYTDYDDTYECSVCGHGWVFVEGTPKENDANYCPNCGAKMEV